MRMLKLLLKSFTHLLGPVTDPAGRGSPVCPFIVMILFICLTSHAVIQLSIPPVYTVFPSFEYATDVS
jgi:hypothetical protein